MGALWLLLTINQKAHGTCTKLRNISHLPCVADSLRCEHLEVGVAVDSLLDLGCPCHRPSDCLHATRDETRRDDMSTEEGYQAANGRMPMQSAHQPSAQGADMARLQQIQKEESMPVNCAETETKPTSQRIHRKGREAHERSSDEGKP